MAEANLPFIRNLASSGLHAYVTPDPQKAAILSLSPSSAPGDAGVIHQDCARPWMAAFWEIVASEWTTGIDVLRMEKFLLLVRRFVCACFSWAREVDYVRERVEVVVAVLAEWPLEKEQGLDKVPLGLRLHVLDVWVDEVERSGVLAEVEEKDGARKLVDGVGDLVRALTKGFPSKPLRQKAANSLDDERLPWYSAPEVADEDDDGWAGFQD
ncbi:hypothetical protein jhhlp_006759 [Lomentospora prolificans]|uniref:Uncharacterized protein n=1 Tax=Lomentospora prolificans TaxID=41688 RepID=A0A2N3N2L9_9PEZI|nr:hypothetical protein jhhlp_006759 [Lomentospora prolificans]